MKKYAKKYLYSRGFKLTRITKDLDKPTELSDEENEIIDHVRSHDLSMCTTLNLQQTAVGAKYIAINNIPGDFVECGVFRGGNALIAAKIFKIHKSEKKYISLIHLLGWLNQQYMILKQALNHLH